MALERRRVDASSALVTPPPHDGEPVRSSPQLTLVTPEYAEVESDPPPTTLTLFDYPQERLDELNEYMQMSTMVRNAINRSARSLIEANGRVNEQIAHLAEGSRDLLTDIIAVDSKRTVDATYGFIVDGLTMANVPLGDANMYFRQLVNRYSVFASKSTEELWKGTPGNGQVFQPIKPVPASEMDRHTIFLMNHAPRKPAWFGGDAAMWAFMFADHIKLLERIGHEAHVDVDMERRDHDDDNHADESSEMSLEVPFGPVYRDALPEWLVDDGEPTPAIVQNDLRILTVERIQLASQLTARRRQWERLQDVINSKQDKYANFSERFKDGLPWNPQSLAELVIGTHATRDLIQMVPKGAEMNLRTGSFTVPQTAPVEHFLYLSFFVTGRQYGREGMGLWLERQLQQGNIMESAQEVITEEQATLLESFFGNQPRPEDSKKSWNALKYRIDPFLSHLGPSERAYLAEWTRVAYEQGGLMEDVLWETAEAMATSLTRESASGLSPSTLKVAHEFNGFFSKWFDTHEEWIYQQLLDRLEEGERPPRESIVMPAKVEQALQEVADDTQEIEEEVERIDRGNLGGWTVNYLPKEWRESNRRDAIEGETKEELTEALAQYLGGGAVSSNIKPGSVINAINWVVGLTEEEFRRLVKKQDLDGEEFYKVYRGGVRILFHMDKDNHELNFFLYQKQSDDYKLY
ncbi:MAG TPA: hypothetical protein VG935_04170 [Patescibacteria group bacterium]|nr:hypothetical protein [Patescibacteria group bacterium]